MTAWTRQDVTFPSQDGHCAGWLYLPSGVERPAVVIMTHGFTSVKEQLETYLEKFAASGLACLAFDYRHFGSSSGEPRQLLDVRRQEQDWDAAIAWVLNNRKLNHDSVGLWATSFSGGHVLTAAARNPSVAAVVCQTGWMDSLAPSQMKLASREHLGRTMRAIYRDVVAARRGQFGVTIAAVGRPGEFAILTQPGAMEVAMRISPPDWPNQVLARSMLRLASHRPGRVASAVRCPALIQTCDNDDITAAGPARKAASRAPLGELKNYPYDHWTIYEGDPFRVMSDDHLEFLHRVLTAHQPSPSQ